MVKEKWLTRKRISSLCESMMFRLETTRYLLDKPTLNYQPLPWIGVDEARRGVGTKERFKAMTGAMGAAGIEPGTALDVGCNVGYFSLSLMERGVFVYGVDGGAGNLVIARRASRSVKGDGKFVPIEMMCDRKNVLHLPNADMVICLSIWHHWVRHYGLEAATSMLTTLWTKAAKALFFDTGENEMPDYYNLPFRAAEPRAWLEGYLKDVCRGGQVRHLGAFAAFPPGGHEGRGGATRNFFMIERKAG